ncbi:MAG: site-2 protease family protein [Leptolyngbya sp. PLA2]|nr:site-2 protease family protein [Leptolyngbya sp.]MCE7971666.1 site-2 protease family protein [Leptolyngbya sp. PL-A2]MCQ3940017.1 site-2 protease family protein [cyanobacterium CYA1]MDL1903241.1 site-2 protease family protein [Synechococcales cyanobacterium CNB]
MHWTFLLLVGWIVFVSLTRGGDLVGTAWSLGFVAALFTCVVLHELGHALAARRYGIATRGITLLPIGGVAALERMPTEPVQEIVIALAGPAVNVVIAGLLFGLLAAFGDVRPTGTPVLFVGEHYGFVTHLAIVNVALVLFNLLPAFPMDGGRVLRALLATAMSYADATEWAARVGGLMAALFVALGLFFNPWLVFIALFVFLGGQAEARAARTRSVLEGVNVGQAMLTVFRALRADETLADASAELLAGSQQDFPVVDADGEVVGVLTRDLLVQALAREGLGASVGSVMLRGCPTVPESADLEDAFERMQTSRCPVLPVLRDGRLVGLLTMENLGEFVMLRGAIDRGMASGRGNATPPFG